MNRQQYAKALAYVMNRYSEKWITLDGGTHVQIDGEGNIIGGPAGLKDKGITNLSHFGNKSSTTVDKKKDSADTPVVSNSSTEQQGKKMSIDPNAFQHEGRLNLDEKTVIVKNDMSGKEGVVRDEKNGVIAHVKYGDGSFVKSASLGAAYKHPIEVLYSEKIGGTRDQSDKYPIPTRSNIKIEGKMSSRQELEISRLGKLLGYGSRASDSIKKIEGKMPIGMSGSRADSVIETLHNQYWESPAGQEELRKQEESTSEDAPFLGRKR